MAKKTPKVPRPSIDRLPEEVALTLDQVKRYFREPWKQAVEDYRENVAGLKEAGDYDPKDPGILHPKACAWSLQKCPPDCFFTAYLTSLEEEGYPGYELHMFDQEAIASFSGGGSDMVWTGEEWEM